MTSGWLPGRACHLCDTVTSCGSLAAGTWPRTLPPTGSTIASALASRSRTSSLAGAANCAAARLTASAKCAKPHSQPNQEPCDLHRWLLSRVVWRRGSRMLSSTIRRWGCGSMVRGSLFHHPIHRIAIGKVQPPNQGENHDIPPHDVRRAKVRAGHCAEHHHEEQQVTRGDWLTSF